MTNENPLVARLREAARAAELNGDGQPMELFTEAANDIEEYERMFQLSWDANQRAIKAWQAAHPGNDNVWPDQAKMVEWLMTRHAIMSGALMTAAEQFRFYEKNHREKADRAFGQPHASPTIGDEAVTKANTNRDMAKLCDDALKGTP